MIWKELFDYIGSRNCIHDYSNTKSFCMENQMYFDELEPILEALGGYCDCEIYLNAENNVDHNSEIPLIKWGKRTREEYCQSRSSQDNEVYQ